MTPPFPESRPRTLVQVVPAAVAGRCGVGDYASALASGLRPHGIDAVLWSGADVRGRSASAWAEALRERSRTADAVLLHYSSFGYSARGWAPRLARGILEWKKRTPNVPLFAYFHEAAFSGPPWTSGFWLGPLERPNAARIWRNADLGAVNSVRTAREVEAMTGSPVASGRVLPVPSTVGEPVVRLPEPSARPPRAVVFGSAALRLKTYRHPRLVECVRKWGIFEIVDVGAPIPLPRLPRGLPVRPAGWLPAARLPEIFSECRLGLLAYAEDSLEKSTVFAAYSAWGLATLLFDPGKEPRWSSPGPAASGLEGAVLDPESAAGDEPTARAARRAGDWYRGHGVEAHVRFWKAALEGGTS